MSKSKSKEVAVVEEVAHGEGEHIELREQLNLFEYVDTDLRRRKEYSNSVDLYDSLPKYSWDQREIEDVQDASRIRCIKLGGQEYQIEVTPAVITRDKRKVFVFPSAREELVEEALRKFVVDGQGTAHGGEVGVFFTMYQLQKELADNGRTYSLTELSEALEVLNKANIEISTTAGDAVLSSPLFPTVVTRSRSEYLKAPTQAKCYVRFNVMVTNSILNLAYRRYDYKLGMSIKSHLARWIHRRMSQNWTQASTDKPYTFTQTSYLAASPRGLSETMSENTRAVKSALETLKKHGIVDRYESEPEKDGRKIIDVRYRVYATQEFVSQTIAHNRHRNELSIQKFALQKKELLSKSKASRFKKGQES